MHHDAELSIFHKAGHCVGYIILLWTCLWDEVCDSFLTLKGSLVIVFEALIPLIAWRRQRREREEAKRRAILRQKKHSSGGGGGKDSKGGGGGGGDGTSGASGNEYSSTASSSTDALGGGGGGLAFSPIASCESLSALIAGDDSPIKGARPSSAADAEDGGNQSKGTVSPTPPAKKKSFSSFHHKGNGLAAAASSSSPSAATPPPTSAVESGSTTTATTTTTTQPASSMAAKTIFPATHIKRAIRAHAGPVPNQMLWVPTGKNPPLWPTQRIVRNLLRSHGVTKPKILALDLDETLLCALPYTAKTAAKYTKPTYHEAIPTASGAEIYTVWERPHVHLFLSTLSRLYTVILFTASVPFYADPFVDRLEGLTPNDYKAHTTNHHSSGGGGAAAMAARIHKPLRIRRRYYRDSCVVIPNATSTPSPPASFSSSQDGGVMTPTPSLPPSAQQSAASTLTGEGSAEMKAQLKQLVAANGSAAVSTSMSATATMRAANGSFSSNESLASATTLFVNNAASGAGSSGSHRRHTHARRSTTGSGGGGGLSPAQRYAKDLSVLGVPLDSIVLVDNSTDSFALYPDNGVLIESYRPPLAPQQKASASSGGGGASTTTSPNPPGPAPAGDDMLLSLIPFLEALYYVPDVRQVLSKRRKE